jgi:hypothetical protein
VFDSVSQGLQHCLAELATSLVRLSLKFRTVRACYATVGFVPDTSYHQHRTSDARVASVRGTITVQLCMGDLE